MSAFQHILNTVLPALCPACHEQAGPGLCETCAAQLQHIEHQCPRCGAACLEDLSCVRCHGRGIRGIQRVFVQYHYNGPMRTLVLQAKVKARRAAVLSLCHCLAIDEIRDWQPQAVCVIPPSRGRRYGPHLATALARHLSTALEIPLLRILKHKRLPAAQHELPAHMRSKNTSDLFSISSKNEVPARIVLLDDLVTSGSTLEAAAHVLHDAGCRDLSAACVARTGINSKN